MERIVIDCTTGEETVEPLSAEEITAREAEIAAAAAAAAAPRPPTADEKIAELVDAVSVLTDLVFMQLEGP